MTPDNEPASAGVQPGEIPEIKNKKFESANQALASTYEGLDLSTLTHLELAELIIRERDWTTGDNSSGRTFRSLISTWCKSIGLSLDDPAHRSLAKDFDQRLNAVTDNLAQTKTTTTAKNVRWAASELKRVFDSIWTYGGLPSDFRLALNRAIESKGWKKVDLVRAVEEKFQKNYQGLVSGYTTGKIAPKYPQSVVVVERLEKALGLPENTLASRAFKRPRLIKLGNDQDIAYRERHSRLCKLPYGLKELPPQLKSMWTDLVSWKSQPHLRVDGELYVPSSVWDGPAAPKKYCDNVRRFFGWLVLPKATKPVTELTQEERWTSGKGMNPEQITLKHLFDTDLIWDYCEYLRCRQHKGKFTQDTKHYVIFLNSLVNHPYSFVKAHEGLAPLFGEQPMARTQWVEFVEKIHQRILKLSRDIEKSLPKKHQRKQRNPDEPLKEIISDADPAGYFEQMIEDLEDRIPPQAQAMSRAIHLRDIALFRLSMDVPLRAGNLSELKIGKSLVRGDDNLWRVYVPIKQLKNRHSVHARNIARTLSEKTSAAIDRYVNEGRPKLKGADETDLFLIAGATGPKRRLPADASAYQLYGVPPASLYWVVRRRTEEVFGVGQGPNIFRHIIATAILKDDGSNKMAAAVLNNSERMIEENYSHVTQDDYLRKANEWAEKKHREWEANRAVWGKTK